MKLRAMFLVGAGMLSVPTPGWADEAALDRTVKVYTGNTVDTPGIIRGARAVGAYNWASVADFPADVPSQKLRVSVGVDLSIDAAGKVLSCKQSYIGTPNPDHRTLTDWTAAACAIVLREGVFTYSMDASGTAVPSTYFMTVEFEMKPPGAAPYMAPPSPPPSSAFYQRRAKPKRDLSLKLRDPAITNSTPRMMLDIDTKGRVSRCRIWNSTGSDAADVAVCRYLTKQKFVPAIGRDGVVTEEKYFRVDLPIRAP